MNGNGFKKTKLHNQYDEPPKNGSKLHSEEEKKLEVVDEDSDDDNNEGDQDPELVTEHKR